MDYEPQQPAEPPQDAVTAGYVDGKFSHTHPALRLPRPHPTFQREPYDQDEDATALAADLTEPVGAPRPALKTWRCWIGEVDPDAVPEGGDSLMREQVELAYHELTGHMPTFVFSGWGGVLSEAYRAAHEDREPDIEVQLAELRPLYEMLVDEAHRQDKLSDPIGRIDWIRRNVGRGEAPESWQINDFTALVTVKLGEAIERLNEDSSGVGLAEPDRHIGRECLLAAATILLDCWERYGDR